MYTFILNMWILRKAASGQIQIFVTKGYITQEEAGTILSKTQVESE